MEPPQTTAKVTLKHVLVIEDDDDLLEAMRELLVDADYIPMVARTGDVALTALRDPPFPGLIVLDLLLPDMTGVAFVQAIRADGRHRDVPILAVSSALDAKELAKQFDHVALLTKPFLVERFMQLVNEHWRAPAE